MRKFVLIYVLFLVCVVVISAFWGMRSAVSKANAAVEQRLEDINLRIENQRQMDWGKYDGMITLEQFAGKNKYFVIYKRSGHIWKIYSDGRVVKE